MHRFGFRALSLTCINLGVRIELTFFENRNNEICESFEHSFQCKVYFDFPETQVLFLEKQKRIVWCFICQYPTTIAFPF